MTIQMYLVRCWIASLLVLVLTSIRYTDADSVVEVNEEDLKDHRVNINLSDLDTPLPVVSLEKPAKTIKQIQLLENRNTDDSSSGKQLYSKTRPVFSKDVLRFVKNLVNTSAKAVGDDKKPKKGGKSVDYINEEAKTQTKISQLLAESPVVANKIQNRTSTNVHDGKNLVLHLSTNQVVSKIQHKEPPTSVHLEKGLVSDKGLSTNQAKVRKRIHPKEIFYDIYDVDRPVTIRKQQKELKAIPKEKQELVNNTLAVYGLHLDSKGENVILKDEESNSQRKGSSQGDIKESQRQQDDSIRIRAQNTKEGSKTTEKYYKKKSVKQDPIQSLWNMFKTVSRKWK